MVDAALNLEELSVVNVDVVFECEPPLSLGKNVSFQMARWNVTYLESRQKIP